MAAPMAQFDEDWQDFNEFKAASDDTLDRVNCNLGEPGPEEDFCPDLESPECGQIRSYVSVEDLVQNFEKKLSACFSNYSTRTEELAPVQSFTEERLLQEDEIWNALTENFGNVMPVDWKTSHTRSLHLPSLNLHQQPQGDGVNLDLSDDEELGEQMDLHSIIVSCVNEEPLFTAEQVISEIEQMMMMQESPGEEDEDSAVSQSDLSLVSQELQTLSHSTSTSSYEERLRGLSVSDLEAQLEEVEKKIRAFSEELIDQLALRDELEFEKEVKNSFISLLIDVQNRQKELLKRRKRGKNSTGGVQRGERTYAPGTRYPVEGFSSLLQKSLRQSVGGSAGDRQYLTTVIPYEKRSGAPSVEDLQILTKILHAMRDDSDKVPSLLTDYILKVLCPT